MEQLEETTRISLSKANMFNSHSNMYKLAEKVKPLDGYDDIFIHGDTFSFSIEDADGKQTTYTVAEIANFIKDYSNFKNDKIRLCSCNTGRDSAIAAQLMADITGKEVMAPNNYLWLIDKGDETQLLIAGEIAEKIDYNDLGEWVTFTPKERRQ